MENIEFNKCQTPLSELGLERQPAEIQEQFWDFLNNVPFSYVPAPYLSFGIKTLDGI